jgi:uncharacterized membrane protein (UPF0136 family)
MTLVTYAAIAYGILALLGGIFGYVKARSQASLISGIISGALLILSGILYLQNASLGKAIALVVTVALIGVFTLRLIKTRRFMPSGLMLVAGCIALIGILVG